MVEFFQALYFQFKEKKDDISLYVWFDDVRHTDLSWLFIDDGESPDKITLQPV